jgi:hypothetical protein
VIWNRTDNGWHKRLDGFNLKILDEQRRVIWLGSFEKATKESLSILVCEIPEDVESILAKAEATRTPEETFTVSEFAAKSLESMDPVVLKKSNLDSERRAIKPVATVPVMEELPPDQRRETKIQVRGSFLITGDVVSAGTPSVFHKLSPVGKIDRLAVAHWLVDRKNPLTARVLVNRLWEQMFGVGLVSTSEEFGSQGDFPTHPELLDWLAVELMESGWDSKHILKLIAMSATYRQSSVVTAEKLQADQFNRLLSRGPRVRLTAEMVRDQALAVSGLLSRDLYGPPVHPPKPKLGLKSAFRDATTDWKTSEGANRYRRGIYTELRRSMPYPSLSTFDCPNREVAELRRIPTNTPLQALVTMNDPVFVEAAQALSRRMVAESEDDSAERIAAKGFELCLMRIPSDAELSTLVGIYDQALGSFQSNSDSAISLATDPLGPLPDQADPAIYAAWTTVANVLLNLDEMFQKR